MNSVSISALAAAVIAGSLLVQGCAPDKHQPGPSADMAALVQLVDLKMPITSGRWEIFGTPAYTGGVPGPTDFVTLVAELAPSEHNWFNSNAEPSGVAYIAPEAARPWLTDPFRHLLAARKNTSADLFAQFGCRKYGATLKKTAKPVDGFVCASGDRVLLYLTLSSSQ